MKSCSSPVKLISPQTPSLPGFTFQAHGNCGGLNPGKGNLPVNTKTSLGLALLLALAVGPHRAMAADGTWANNPDDASAGWGLSTNWVSGAIPGANNQTTANTDTANFIAAVTVENPVLESDWRLARINIDNSGADYNIGAASVANVLYLQGILTGLSITGGGSTSIDPLVVLGDSHAWSTGSTEVTLKNGLSFAKNVQWTLVNTSPVKIEGTLRGASGAARTLTFAGSGSAVISASVQNTADGKNTSISSAAGFSGTVTLTGNNTFTPTEFYWRSGNLEIGSDTALGTNALALALGTSTTANATAINVLTTGAFTVNRDIIFTKSTNTVDYTVGGTQTSGTSVYKGQVNINDHTGGLKVTSAAGGTVDFSGEIKGTLSAETKITKVGDGIVRFTKSTGNSYVGGTTVSAGTLLVENVSGSGSGTGAVVVNGGTLGGTGIISGAVTVAGGATIMGGDGIAASGGLRLSGGLTLQDASTIELTLGAGGTHSSLSNTGTASWVFDSDQLFSFVNAGAKEGFYDNIITGLIGDPATTGSWRIANDGWSGTFSYDGSNIDLTLTAIPEPSAWSLLLGSAGLAFLLRRRMKSCPQ